MAKKRKLTARQKTLQTEYRKHVRRIKSFLREATKRGFQFPSNILPPKPEKITKKHVEQLNEIRPASMYKEAKYVDPDTGEVVSGFEGRKLERRKASEKGRKKRESHDSDLWANAIIQNFRDILKQYNHEGASILNRWLDELISNFGKNNVAFMLEFGARNGYIVTYEVVYFNSVRRAYTSGMISYLPSVEPEDKVYWGVELIEALEEDEDFGEPV